MSTCRSCGAEIKWVRMKSGKAMPVDPCCRSIITAENGEAVIVTDDGEVVKGCFASFSQGANKTGYVSHFSTCPYANEHRRKNR